MFDFNPFIQLVIFILWLDQDRDEDLGFHLINPDYMELLSIHDSTHDPFYSDRFIHAMDSYK